METMACQLDIRLSVTTPQLTEVSDAVANHHTLQVDRLLLGSYKSLVAVHYGGRKDRKVSALM